MTGLGSRPRLFLVIVSALALTTSLPFLTGLLLTDIFAGVSVHSFKFARRWSGRCPHRPAAASDGGSYNVKDKNQRVA